MSQATTLFPDPHQGVYSKTILGFWIYLMTDCIIFATLFATYGLLHSNTFGGPTSQEIFSLSTSFIETMLLLCSSFTCGLGMLEARKEKIGLSLIWFIITFALGLSFVGIEVSEFSSLVREGYSWERSAFLSGFFSLVGTHGFHVSVGLLWLAILMVQIFVKGVTTTTFRRLVCFNMFWHFLDLVWVFIFSLVYLLGVLA